ncbi:unnamed protein product [Ilex paraguariensis]|uniref:Cell wall protein n=1 Tax=Ilex paraguariensis TaxID=185542 RepID=A0ABC8SKB5_9AQUA
MAYKSGSILAFLFILNVLLSLSGHALAGRDIPMNDSKNTDKKQPESFFDGSVLIPGFGRVMVPRIGSPFNPFTYNPVTGTNGGTGATIPGFGSIPSTGGTSSGSYVPGGDDTFVPNPGFEVPTPGSGSSIPAPSGP